MQTSLTAEEERENLRQVAALANDYAGQEDTWKKKRYSAEDAERFRRMLRALQAWRDSGERNIGRMKLEAEDRAKLDRYTARMQLHVLRNGTMSVIYTTPWNEAIYQFTRLLHNSQLDFLGGPCRNRKKHDDRDHWFVRQTRRPSVFCSRQCAGDATKANERQRAHDRKIEAARRAIRNYAKRPSRFKSLSWQEWVILDHPKISKKFLTMAVKGGYLISPRTHA